MPLLAGKNDFTWRFVDGYLYLLVPRSPRRMKVNKTRRNEYICFLFISFLSRQGKSTTASNDRGENDARELNSRAKKRKDQVLVRIRCTALVTSPDASLNVSQRFTRNAFLL